MSTKNILAFDFGASSIRMFHSTLDKNKNIATSEIIRYANTPLLIDGVHCWDIPKMKEQIFKSLSDFKNKNNIQIESIAFDSWGVDYVWLNKDGELLELPRTYRNEIDPKIINEVTNKISVDQLYKITGIINNSINSIYRIYEDIHYRNILDKGGWKILFIPDYFNYLLTGKINYEYTICATSGLMDICKKEWSNLIFEKLDLPLTIVDKINITNDFIGPIINEPYGSIFTNEVKITRILSHDSASAVLGSGINNNQAFIINGTWSLIGIINNSPIINNSTQLGQLSNEGFYNGSVRINRLMVGLWILQNVYKQWFKDNKIDYNFISKQSKKSTFNLPLDINEHIFSTQCDMIDEIIKYFKKQNIKIDRTDLGSIVKCVHLGLANEFKKTKIILEKYMNQNINEIILLGGGNNDKNLCEIISKELNVTTSISHPESSIIGNSIAQFISLGYLKYGEVNKILKNSIKNIK